MAQYSATYRGSTSRMIDLPDLGRRRLVVGQTLAPLSEADKAALDAEGWPVAYREIEEKAPRQRTTKPAKKGPSKGSKSEG